MPITRSGKLLTRKQVKSRITKKRIQTDHFNIIMESAAKGFSKKQAAKAAGMSESGVSNLLYHKLKTTVWPPASNSTIDN